MMMPRQFWFSCGTVLVVGCGGAPAAVSTRAGNLVALTRTTRPSRPATAAVATSRPSPSAPSIADPDERAVAELRRASALFETFVAKAGNEPRFADAVRRSKARMEDIQATLAFLEEGLRERNGR